MHRIFERATSWTTLIAFALGLWLGYRGAVLEARACHRASSSRAATCPDWLRAD